MRAQEERRQGVSICRSAHFLSQKGVSEKKVSVRGTHGRRPRSLDFKRPLYQGGAGEGMNPSPRASPRVQKWGHFPGQREMQQVQQGQAGLPLLPLAVTITTRRSVSLV